MSTSYRPTKLHDWGRGQEEHGVAIGNYINQRLLKPVHDWLMQVLARIPGDGTFNQTVGWNNWQSSLFLLQSMQLIGPTQLQPIPVFLYKNKKSWPPVQVDHLGCCTIGWLSRSFLRAFLKSDLSGTCLQVKYHAKHWKMLNIHFII